ncbi:ATP-binding protein [Kitasatospora sp. NPDC094028]
MLKTCCLPRPRAFATRLAPCIESTRLARQLLRAYLCALPSGDRFSDVAELLLGELFTNAVQHSDAPDDRLIEIRFAVTNHLLRLEVHDAGSGRPSLRAVSPDDECGRGLFLVNELSTRWGCCPRAGGIGKYVWALISPSPALAA